MGRPGRTAVDRLSRNELACDLPLCLVGSNRAVRERPGARQLCRAEGRPGGKCAVHGPSPSRKGTSTQERSRHPHSRSPIARRRDPMGSVEGPVKEAGETRRSVLGERPGHRQRLRSTRRSSARSGRQRAEQAAAFTARFASLLQLALSTHGLRNDDAGLLQSNTNSVNRLRGRNPREDSEIRANVRITALNARG
jgi:hypothetical protein